MRARPTSNPKNRFLSSEFTYDDPGDPTAHVELIDDASRTIVAHNDSPDVGFDWSVNPYRGCVHACAYCYARPTHEYLGYGAGTDFDTRIVVKRRAPELLREAFEKPSWAGERLVFSGVTDCYQPVEKDLRLTRACLEVCAEYRNPVGVITKSTLVERDVDVLARLVAEASVQVRVSIPFLDAAHARAVEPWVATPERRLKTIRVLADAGIPVGVNVAPVIPGLTDDAVPGILEAARDAGATFASYILLRLPGSVAPVFEERMRAAFPDRAERILSAVRSTRGGLLSVSTFGDRMKGSGVRAETIRSLFHATTRRLGLRAGAGAESANPPERTFRRPPHVRPQLDLFGG